MINTQCGARPGTRLLVAAILALGAAACGDSFSPQDVAGTYQATLWTLSGAVTADALAEGASITVTLELDGTTSGIMIVPESLSDQGEFAADLAGTYRIDGDRLRFVQAAETFVRNVLWDIGDGILTASGFFAGTEIRVVLTRTGSPET